MSDRPHYCHWEGCEEIGTRHLGQYVYCDAHHKQESEWQEKVYEGVPKYRPAAFWMSDLGAAAEELRDAASVYPPDDRAAFIDEAAKQAKEQIEQEDEK